MFALGYKVKINKLDQNNMQQTAGKTFSKINTEFQLSAWLKRTF